MGGRKTSRIIIITLFGSVIFLLPSVSRAAPDHLVINEIQTTGGEGHTTNDFVELFNPTSAPFNLKGHRLVKRTAAGTSDTTLKSWTDDTIIPAYGFYLWANSDYVSILTAPDITTSGSLADNNGIALRQGAADTGTIIDSLAWGNSTNLFIEGTVVAANPGPNQSLERQKPQAGSRQDTNNNANDFTTQASPTPQNSTTAPETPAPAGNNSTGTYPMSPTNNPQSGEVVINEIVSDPGSGNEEWLELYNRSTRLIDLSKFTLEDGSHTITQLNGSLGTDGNSRFIVIKSPKGNLNNDGDIVILKFADTIIDQVTYGNWDDGNTSNNAPVARTPLGIGRLPDGQDNNNDQMDWVITNPTIGASNQAGSPALANSDNKTASLTFSEIYPNPPLSDQADEFIELFNNGDQAINLSGWIIKDEITAHTVNSQTWTSTIIEPKKFFILPRPKTGIALDNDGTEHLTLSSSDNKTILKISYTGPAAAGASYAKNEQGEWQWTTQPTPGQLNKIILIDEPPHLGFFIPKKGAVGELIILDASDTVDPEGKPVNVLWDLGDGTFSTTITPSHIYSKAGRYTVKLKALDQAGNETSDSQTITIENSIAVSGKVAGLASGPIELTEIMPNPKGSDANEWLELYNPNDTVVTTAGWQIQANEHNYKLPNYEVLPETYLVINKKDSNFSLLNKKTNLALIAPTGEKTNQLEYDGVKEGYSYALENKVWQWTSEPTPGSENIIALVATNGDYQAVALAEARLLDSGNKIITEGVVSLAPDSLTKNLMFLGSEGLQISLSDNNWPTLKTGDLIKISGTISRSTTGTKLLVRKSDQLTITGSGPAPEPANLNLTDITEDNEGQLITTSGQITRSTARSFAISADNTNLAVSLKNTELNWPKLKTGTAITLTGFVTLTKDGLKFFVRSPEDIVIKTLPLPPPQVIDIAQNPEKSNWASYILAIATVLVIVTMYFWQKFNWPNLLKLIGGLLKNKAANHSHD
ncbi:MAG: lamin tail domain-containing protein [Candidatus Kerfeldbacteria bacterium]|nr:lamin tail domain-containing protein [Candidatus Kerfeldbacteria bacterium]